MTTRDLLESSYESLVRTKSRSALTMLGIVIGILSVILMLTIGEAAQRYILSQVSAFGSDVVYVANGPKVDAGQPSAFLKQTLTLKDVRKIRLQSWASMVVGIIIQDDQLTANGYDTNIQVIGTMSDEPRFSDRRLMAGSFFDEAAFQAGSRDAVLGFTVADNAFGAENPIGKSVKIGTVSFKVVGVMEKAGSQSFQNLDKQVYIPVTAAMALYSREYVDRISVKTTVPTAEAKYRLEILLRDQHNIENPEGELTKDDFNVTTQEDAVESASTITNILQILLVSIAAISLIVGGIGIMNIMYVSVTERIKEIGLRKAIGAKRKDILGQFLAEAVMLTTVGGALGIVLGILLGWAGISAIASFQEGWTFAVSWRGVFLGLTISAAIGVAFGYFPARRAAKLSPIEALRFE